MGLQKQVLTIAAGASASDEIEMTSLGQCNSLSIQAPATLTNAVTLQSADAEDGTNWTAVQSPPGTDITIAAAKTTPITELPFPRLRLNAAGVEVAERQFIVWMRIGN